LQENPDILAELARTRTSGRPLLVGFAAETGDESATVLDHARAKLARKGSDLLVVNDVSAGRAFDTLDNEVVVLSGDGGAYNVPRGPKIEIAQAIWDV